MPESAFIEPSHRSDPERIGGYAIIGRLGAGSMGEVFLGRSAAGRLVAVKTIKVDLADEPDFRERFAREVAAARRVSGAFTAPVIAADPHASRPWLATAYLPAPSLNTVIGECGPLPAPAVRWLGAGCAEALESIHAAGLVHRDLKPSNVLVSLDGPRVIDFGLARSSERAQLTAARSAVGTPAYMAPEQARDNQLVSTASDVYSLGASMLFAATGHGPHPGETVMDVLTRLATEPPDLTGLPSGLLEIVMGCLRRDPRERPTTSAILAHLAREIGADADAGELGSRLLPPSALALIGQYRRGLRSQAGTAADRAEDETFSSRPATVYPPGPAHRVLTPPSGSASSGRGLSVPRLIGRQPPRGPARSVRRRSLTTVVVAAVGLIALTAGGAAIGTYLTNRPTSSTAGRTVGDVGASSSVSPQPGPTGGNRSPRPAFGFGPGPGGQFGPGGGPPGPPPPGVPRPYIRIVRRFNGRYTVFTVRGSRWRPGIPITVTLVYVGTAPTHPIVNKAGHFSFTLNAPGSFFHNDLTISGTYQVEARGPGRAMAFATLVVHHA